MSDAIKLIPPRRWCTFSPRSVFWLTFRMRFHVNQQRSQGKMFRICFQRLHQRIENTYWLLRRIVTSRTNICIWVFQTIIAFIACRHGKPLNVDLHTTNANSTWPAAPKAAPGTHCPFPNLSNGTHIISLDGSKFSEKTRKVPVKYSQTHLTSKESIVFFFFVLQSLLRFSLPCIPVCPLSFSQSFRNGETAGVCQQTESTNLPSFVKTYRHQQPI